MATTYKTILVHLGGGPRTEVRLKLAVSLAGRSAAHLIGLYVPDSPRMPPYVTTEIPASVMEGLYRDAARRMEETAQRFSKATREAGIACFEWRVVEDRSTDAAVRETACADLVVIGQGGASEENCVIDNGFEDSVILGSGSPILVVPHSGGFNTIGNNVLVAWNGGREAARALKDALPLLAGAREVTVMTIGPKAPKGESTAAVDTDVGRFLSRHGVHAKTIYHVNSSIDAGELLLSRAADLGADLIVMGAYGHTRLRELILGGVTRTLLEKMTVPVLLSH